MEGYFWSTVQFKLKADWTYNSNAMEDPSLTLSETIFFLREGLTVKGRFLADHLDARNHAEAIDLLYEDEQKNISSGLLKKLNSLWLCGIRYNPILSSKRSLFNKPVNPGQYKETPNHVVTPSGEVLTYVAPADVPDEIEKLIHWLEHEKTKKLILL